MMLPQNLQKKLGLEEAADLDKLAKEEQEAVDSYQTEIDNSTSTEEKEVLKHIQSEEEEHEEELAKLKNGEEVNLDEAKEARPLVSNGIYSVLNDTWIKEPSQTDIPDVDQTEVDKAVEPWKERYEKIIADPKREEIESFLDEIYVLRQESIASDGEFGIGNLVFKECRNNDYIDNLKDALNKIKEKELSLEEKLQRGQLTNKEFYQYRDKLNRAARDQVILQQNGRFEVNLVPENEVDVMVSRLRALPFVKNVYKVASGKYDFRQTIKVVTGLPPRYWTVHGEIEIEDEEEETK